MLCPKCGAYSPYNTPVCNRCGTNLLGKKAGKPPRHSHSGRYYSRIRKSEWEQKRDQLVAKANDSLDGIMADRDKRIRLILAICGAALIVIIAVTCGAACACGGCGSCGNAEVPPAVSSSQPDSPFGTGSLFGEEEPSSGTDISPSDEAASTSDAEISSPFGAGALFGNEDAA